MSLLVPPRRFDPEILEMMDRPGQPRDLLRADLRVLERINRFLGGYRIPLACLRAASRRSPSSPDRLKAGPPLTVLDLATGAADVPRAVVRWCRQHGVPVEIVGVDANPEILRVARERTRGWPEIRLESGDLRSLPYPPGSFDVVLCSLVLHHFSEADAVAILRRIRDIARVAYGVSDLRRNRMAIWLARGMARTILANPIARFDAPVSCERAFSLAEFRSMAARAGISPAGVRRGFAFRLALTTGR